MKMFPIQTDGSDIEAVRKAFGISVVVAMPWPMMTAHEAQAQRNHDQDVAELARRSGLSACEAVAVLEDRPWRSMNAGEAHARLKELFQTWVASTNEQKAEGT